jgi:hypothetical protein
MVIVLAVSAASTMLEPLIESCRGGHLCFRVFCASGNITT